MSLLGSRFMAMVASTAALAIVFVSASPAATASKSWKVVLGANNPAPGDCTTPSRKKVAAVGRVRLIVTATKFEAQIKLEHGLPNTSFGVYMQQVSGSCPQSQANGGTFTSSAAGRASLLSSVPRVQGATTFFIQLVTATGQPGTYTSTYVTLKPKHA